MGDELSALERKMSWVAALLSTASGGLTEASWRKVDGVNQAIDGFRAALAEIERKPDNEV